jgi:hypothetical protein
MTFHHSKRRRSAFQLSATSKHCLFLAPLCRFARCTKWGGELGYLGRAAAVDTVDRVKLASYLPSLLDTTDELTAVAAKLGAAAGDIHLGSDASEATVKRTALAGYGLVAGDVAGLGESLTMGC